MNVSQIDEIEKFKKILNCFNSVIIIDKKFNFQIQKKIQAIYI